MRRLILVAQLPLMGSAAERASIVGASSREERTTGLQDMETAPTVPQQPSASQEYAHTDTRPHRLGETVHDLASLFDIGVWVVFVAWAIAIHLCQGDTT